MREEVTHDEAHPQLRVGLIPSTAPAPAGAPAPAKRLDADLASRIGTMGLQPVRAGPRALTSTTPATQEDTMTDGIYTPNTKRGDVEVRLSYPTRSGAGVAEEDRHLAALTITDRTSGQTLVSLELSAAEYLSMMSSTGTVVSGATLPARPDRIGLRRQNTSTAIGRGVADPEARIAEAVDAYQIDGWETEVRRTNSGHQVIARRWIDDNGNPVP